MHLAVMHDADGYEVRAHLRDCLVHPLDAGRANNMAVMMRFEDVRLAQRGYAVGEHAARGSIDDAMRQPGLMARPARDDVAALLDEEVGPVFQPVFVDAVDIG